MMDHLVANLLNQYLGKYIQNLESENLNVGIFRGEVELTDLQLRPEALFELQLPVEVKAGVVGKIRLTIPWTSLYTSPVTAVLEDVYILVGPIGDRKYDAAKEAAQRNAIKRQKLEALENKQDETKDGTSGEDQGFMEKLMATVVNNIQISVHRIHIRYEDNVTNRQHPFSCGVMLKKLTAETTNGQWKATQIDGGATRIHKLVQLNGLSLYWNPYLKDHSMVRNHIHTTVWRNLLKNSIDSYTIKEQELDFIIRPVSATCKMVLNKDSLSVMPRVMVDFTLDDIEVLVSRLQVNTAVEASVSTCLMTAGKYSSGGFSKYSSRDYR
ncbi:Vacuolar protein sorting-associated protein 13A [Lamellibrachia satsuma]|nr:Vacuolar protein sorting-associated protein 13A [Lamellibrachia satsuma]